MHERLLFDVGVSAVLLHIRRYTYVYIDRAACRSEQRASLDDIRAMRSMQNERRRAASYCYAAAGYGAACPK
jgi:hypothetical protein